jgi:TonB family protein
LPVGQLGRRQAVLFSLIVHLMIVSFLANRTKTDPPKPKPEDRVVRRSPPLIYVPPPGRRVPAPPPPVEAVPRIPLERIRPVPTPTPPPPPPDGDRSIFIPRSTATPPPPPTPAPGPPKDRVSVGTAEGAAQRRLIPTEPGGGASSPSAQPGTPGQPVPPAPEAVGKPSEATEERAGIRRVRPRGSGEPPVLPEDRSIAGSVRRLEQRMADLGPIGDGGSGAVRQMGPLQFDPQGADFTSWLAQWGNEVYRNWIVPQAAIFGFGGGEVTFEFVVERNGTVSSVRMLKSTGHRSYDRAAENALRGGRFQPLPSDYGPARVTMTVTFIYSVRPS